MEQSKIISSAIKIHHLTNLNTYLLNQNREFMYHHEMIAIPAFMPGSDNHDILYFVEKMTHQEQLYSYTNEWGLHYYGYHFMAGMEGYTVIIGPYFDKTPNLYHLTRDYDLSNAQSEDLRVFGEKVYVLPAEQSSSFASVLQQFKAIIEQETAPIILVSEKNKSSASKKLEDFNVDKEAELVKLRYKTEQDFMHAVEQGDKTKALELINSNNVLFYFSERFPNQPLRRLKNLAIVLNTLLRTAAKNSYVPAILIHRISEKFAFEIENANQLKVLYQLEDRMIEEYCSLVSSSSLKKYSTLIQRAIEHLQSSYDKQINKEELADLLSTHPSHLSRKFKEETKMTITSYQQMLRIKKAKHLLKTEELTIEEIAWMIGYDDPSYFARVFKKEIGSTPTQYRDRL
ncbi:AraC family transcriptional regulator [Neobacillus niacini]|uniref:helix-turn-helix transcriptional regulator n=1 Tax=Neobacillus niacini TaxID=86668 RepID=UPI002FFEE5F1